MSEREERLMPTEPPPFVEPDREEREITTLGAWLDWRRGDITASRIAALFDQHPFMTRDQLAASQRGWPAQVVNAAMRRGRILEPAVAAAIAEEHPDWRLTKATTYHRLPAHRIGATPDYWLRDADDPDILALVQTKTVSPQEWEKWQGHPPLAYSLQTLTEMLVTGRERGVLAVLVCSASYPLHLFEIRRHAAAEQKILDAVADWWRAWDAGNLAVVAPSAELAADLDDGSHVDLSADNLLPALLPERERLKAEVSVAEARLKEIDSDIKNRIGTARTAWLPGWAISYATQRRKEFVTPAKDIRSLRVKATMENEP